MSEPDVIYERDGAIGHVRLNRPDAMNALSEALLEELFHRLREANADAGTRVVVISGAGEHFCAGGDLSWEAGMDDRSAARLMRLTGHLSFELRNAPKPVLGAIRGYCLGGGLELSLHLDLVIASETAQFASPETRWGVLPYWNTPQLLPLVVGERRAREILLMGRSYDAEQAYELGLCNIVVPDDELEAEAAQWAAELAVRSATSLHLVRVALNSASDVLRGAANHEALVMTTIAGSGRYRAEIDEFFRLPRDERRPRPGWETRVRRS